jgi:hypothetical protein
MGKESILSFNGSGVFNRLYNWANDKAAGIKIRADRMDNEMNGFATGLSTCLTKDGQTTVTANLPMTGFRHTGAGDATARSDYSTFGQLQDGKSNWIAAGGTADAITAAYSPSIGTLVDGQLFYVRAGAANATTTPTFSPNGNTARTITKIGGAALSVGDIAGANHELILRYNLANTRYELLNPFINQYRATTAGTSTAYTATIAGIGSLYDGLTVNVLLHVASGSTPTFNLNSLGAKSIALSTAAAPTSGRMFVNTWYTLVYHLTLDRWNIVSNYFGTAAAYNIGTSGTALGLLNTANTFGAVQTFFTPTTAAASINLPHGVAPTSPVNGDMWTTTSGAFARVNGATVQLDSAPLNSFVRVNTINGNGSTNTAIRRWTTTVSSSGSDITYADSAANGGSFTINTAGVYAISYTESSTAGGMDFGISLNTTGLTTDIASLATPSERLVMSSTGGASFKGNCSVTVRLAASDVIRAHNNLSATGNGTIGSFTITRVQ